RESYRQNRCLVPAKSREFLTCRGVPQPHRPVFRSRSQSTAVGTERDDFPQRSVGMRAKCPMRLVSSVPDLDSPIVTGRRQPRSVWTEHGTLHRVQVAFDGAKFDASAHVPDLSGSIPACGNQLRSVRAEIQTVDTLLVTVRNGPDLNMRSSIPNLDRA